MALDDLIKRRFAKRAAQRYSSGRFTATQTGAKAMAQGGRISIKDYAAQSGRQLTPKGATPQFAPPSQQDIEDMIQPKKKR